jgi:hypothetical protein
MGDFLNGSGRDIPSSGDHSEHTAIGNGQQQVSPAKDPFMALSDRPPLLAKKQ